MDWIECFVCLFVCFVCFVFAFVCCLFYLFCLFVFAFAFHLFFRSSRHFTEITLTEGMKVDLLKLHDSGWWKGRTEEGLEGWFPYSYVKLEDLQPLELKIWKTQLQEWGFVGLKKRLIDEIESIKEGYTVISGGHKIAPSLPQKSHPGIFQSASSLTSSPMARKKMSAEVSSPPVVPLKKSNTLGASSGKAVVRKSSYQETAGFSPPPLPSKDSIFKERSRSKTIGSNSPPPLPPKTNSRRQSVASLNPTLAPSPVIPDHSMPTPLSAKPSDPGSMDSGAPMASPPKPKTIPPGPKRSSSMAKMKQERKDARVARENPNISEDALAMLIEEVSSFNFDNPEYAIVNVEELDFDDDDEDEPDDETEEQKRDTLSLNDITGIMSVLDNME